MTEGNIAGREITRRVVTRRADGGLRSAAVSRRQPRPVSGDAPSEFPTDADRQETRLLSAVRNAWIVVVSVHLFDPELRRGGGRRMSAHASASTGNRELLCVEMRPRRHGHRAAVPTPNVQSVRVECERIRNCGTLSSSLEGAPPARVGSRLTRWTRPAGPYHPALSRVGCHPGVSACARQTTRAGDFIRTLLPRYTPEFRPPVHDC